MSPLIDALLEREGGLVNDKNDRGGLTNFGISQKQFPSLAIKSLTREQAAAIYTERFLQAPKIDQLPAAIQDQMLDFAVNSGPAVAIQKLQTVLKVPVDGVIGPGTLAAAHAADPRVLNNRLMAERIQMFCSIVIKAPAQLKFLRGWITRALGFLQ